MVEEVLYGFDLACVLGVRDGNASLGQLLLQKGHVADLGVLVRLLSACDS